MKEACPEDCRLSNWTAFSACSMSCGVGVEVSTRHVLTPDRNGGAPCESLVSVRPCEAAAPCECDVSAWGHWSSCSHSCGELGTMVRTRAVIRKDSPKRSAAAAHPTYKCPPKVDIIPCNRQPCGQDCVMSAWSNWTDCSSEFECLEGVRSRHRTVLQQSAFGGKRCNRTVESRPCRRGACPVDCSVGIWSNWSDCSTSCAGGVSSRSKWLCALFGETAFGYGTVRWVTVTYSTRVLCHFCLLARPVLRAPDSNGSPCPLVKHERPCNSIG